MVENRVLSESQNTMKYFRVRENISAMQGYTPGEQPQTGKFIKLNTNENPYPPSAQVTQAIARVAEGGLLRYPDAMADAFRIRAAQLWNVDQDWILCGNGSDDLLTILTRTFVGEGETLRLPYPSYVLYRTLAQIQGAIYEEIHFESDWTLNEQFTSTSSQPKLAFLPNPNSPSGTLISKEVIAQMAERLPCPLIVDEAYADFADSHCIELVKDHENVVVTRSLSKSYGLAGLRFGYLIAQPRIVRELSKVKDSYNCDALAIAGATAAIDDQDWLADNRNRIVTTRRRLEDGMSELGFSVQPSQANFVWSTHSEQPVQPLYEQLKSKRILVRYMQYPEWGDGLRISVGTDDQIEACLATLRTVM